MINLSLYKSPIGNLLLASKCNKLIGLWIEGQKYYPKNFKEDVQYFDDNVLLLTKKWLEKYFKKEKPNIYDIPLQFDGSSFSKTVWQLLCEVSYGQVITYKQLATNVARKLNLAHMSAQAVGQAVARNPIALIVPCHRVIGTNGTLTGYAGGINKKAYLLNHEGINNLGGTYD